MASNDPGRRQLPARLRTVHKLDEHHLKVPSDFAIIVAAFTTAATMGVIALVVVAVVLVAGGLIFSA